MQLHGGAIHAIACCAVQYGPWKYTDEQLVMQSSQCSFPSRPHGPRGHFPKLKALSYPDAAWAVHIYSSRSRSSSAIATCAIHTHKRAPEQEGTPPRIRPWLGRRSLLESSPWLLCLLGKVNGQQHLLVCALPLACQLHCVFPSPALTGDAVPWHACSKQRWRGKAYRMARGDLSAHERLQ